MASFQTFGILLCVSLLVVLPSPAEARATGGWLRFLKMLEEVKEDYPFPAEDYPSSEEEEAVPLTEPRTSHWNPGMHPPPPPTPPPMEEDDVPVRGCRVQWHKFSQDAIETITWEHNKYRTKIARGQETRGKDGPQPSATNMNYLFWDNNLEAAAQKWADTCPSPGPNGHSNNGYGENIYWTGEYDDPMDRDEWLQKMPKEVLSYYSEHFGQYYGWYDEVDKWSTSQINDYVFGGPAGHYSQVVWAESTRVGCGISSYQTNSGKYRIAVVCNYNPGGNVDGRNVYNQGAPCSGCSNPNNCWNKGLCY